MGHSFKKDLSIAEIVRRAAALDAAEGPIVKHPPGTATVGFLGKAKTRDYLERLALAA